MTRSGLKTLFQVSGVFLCSGVALSYIPRAAWNPSTASPLITGNVIFIALIVIINAYRRYKHHVQVALFYGAIYLFNCTKAAFVGISFSTKNTIALIKTLSEIPNFERDLRILVQFTLVSNCIMPSLSEYLNVESLQSFVAYKCLLDLVNFIKSEIRGDEAAPERPGPRGPLHPQQVERSPRSKPVSILIHTFKGVVSVSIMAHQIYRSLWYFVTTFAYFLIAHRILDGTLTRGLETAQLDALEGLEQYYVAGFLGLSELLLAFVFMVWSLLQHQQFIMLVALYSNVYTGGRDLVKSVVSAAFTEWTILAHFRYASPDELASLNDVCAICLSRMRAARKTPCSHYFHGHCLRRSLRERASCPMCSTEFTFFQGT